jgi:uncharacterized OsmC-like protein
MAEFVFMTGPSADAPRQTLRCRTIAESAHRHHNYLRNLPALTVEERHGPPDEAQIASPSETLLAALGSCFSARIHANATAGNVTITKLELHVEVDVGSGSFWDPPGTVPAAVGFESIRIAVHIDADASPGALDALVRHALLWSPVANTLHDPVHLDVSVRKRS